MPLALDMGSDVEHQPAISSDLPIIRIVKPAREATPEYLYEPPVFTTVMDHPVGQLWAVYQAAEYYRNFLPTEIPSAASALISCLSRTPLLTRWAA